MKLKTKENKNAEKDKNAKNVKNAKNANRNKKAKDAKNAKGFDRRLILLLCHIFVYQILKRRSILKFADHSRMLIKIWV